jgi:hypothetical protein
LHNYFIAYTVGKVVVVNSGEDEKRLSYEVDASWTSGTGILIRTGCAACARGRFWLFSYSRFFLFPLLLFLGTKPV